MALELIEAALSAGVPFRAVVADCAYGDNETFEAGLWAANLPYVVSLKPTKGTSTGVGRPSPATGPLRGDVPRRAHRRGGQPT